MKDFAVNIADDRMGQMGLYLYIGFSEKFSADHKFVGCYGSAIVLSDEKKEYEFDYAFGHTPDWTLVTDMMLQPVEKYSLDKLQLVRLGSDIVNYIKSFISHLN